MRMLRSSLPAALLVASIGCLLAGCPKAPAASTSTVGASEVAIAGHMTTSVTPEGLTQVKVDLNKDGRSEITNYYRDRGPDTPRLLMRKETDLNHDGKIDVRTNFDDGGQRELEEMDGDFDGRVDWVDHYIGGKRTTSNVDTDFNGSFDMVKYYEAGKIRSKERDTDADGKMDMWEYLDETGAVVKTGRDIDGDGKMDQRGE